MPAHAAHVPLWIDLAAVAVGAMQGGAFATVARDERNDFDVLGVAVFAIVVGLGGGIVRDVLLGQVPAALEDDRYLGVALAAALIGMLASEAIPRLGVAWDALDAAVVGLFVVVGALKAQDTDVTAGATILLGTVTGVGGSVLRDLLAQQPVHLVQRSTPYALVAILGATTFVVLEQLGAGDTASSIACLVVVFVVRMLALARGWRSPAPVVRVRRRPRRS
ncbi:MAG TPA: TRIC cation channel family protein [Baekduia sp.]|nr:TRIC cation channel family protein [Baekduia sp.]